MKQATIDQMLRDASNVETAIAHGVTTWAGPAVQQIGDLCCHVKALATWLEESQAESRKRFEDWKETVEYTEGIDAMLDGIVPTRKPDGSQLWLKERVQMLVDRMRRFFVALEWIFKTATGRRERAALSLDNPATITPYADTPEQAFIYWRGYREGLTGINAKAHDALHTINPNAKQAEGRAPMREQNPSDTGDGNCRLSLVRPGDPRTTSRRTA